MAQTNIYDELIIALYDAEKRTRDVDEFQLSWSGKKYEGNGHAFLNALEEIKKLNLVYDNGYGCQMLFGWVKFKDATWLDRDEYDGAEGWEYLCPPTLDPEPPLDEFVEGICKNKTMVICNTKLHGLVEKVISERDGIKLCPENTNDIKGAIYIVPIEEYLDTPEKLFDVVYPFYHSKILLTISDDSDWMSNDFYLKKHRLLACMYEPRVLMSGSLYPTKGLEILSIPEKRLEITLKNI